MDCKRIYWKIILLFFPVIVCSAQDNGIVEPDSCVAMVRDGNHSLNSNELGLEYVSDSLIVKVFDEHFQKSARIDVIYPYFYLEGGADKFNKRLSIERARSVAMVKTNLLYDLASFTNLSVEVPIYRDLISALCYYQFPWWRTGQSNNEYCNRFVSLGFEARWWFRKSSNTKFDPTFLNRLTGHFVGLYAESGIWDFQYQRKICHQGEFWSVGLSYGYSMPIGKRLNLEFSLSVGYASIPYRGYTPSEDYKYLFLEPDKIGTLHYLGPTKAQISLVVPIIAKIKRGGSK